MFPSEVHKKRASADTHNGHRLRLLVFIWGFKRDAKSTFITTSERFTARMGKHTGLSSSEAYRGKILRFSTFIATENPSCTTASRNTEGKRRLPPESSACKDAHTGGTDRCIFAFRLCQERSSIRVSIFDFCS